MKLLSISDFQPTQQPQVFPLQGSKRRQFPLIRQFIPEGSRRIVEPFCGSAATSIGALRSGLVKEALISDVNISIANLWDIVITSPLQLIQAYRELWEEQFIYADHNEYFYLVREIHNQDKIKLGVRAAAVFLFLLNRITKASLRYNQQGDMNQSPDKRRHGTHPKTVEDKILEVSNILEGTQVKHCDWIETITSTGKEDILYLDPPYQGTSTKKDPRYISGMSIETFQHGLQFALDRGIPFIVSYDSIAADTKDKRQLDKSLELISFNINVGLSSQATLLGRRENIIESLHLCPHLVDLLGGMTAVESKIPNRTQRK